jgi:hypothetical protein
LKSLRYDGESAGIRTLDLLIKSQLLYRLSYALPGPVCCVRRKWAEICTAGLFWSTQKKRKSAKTMIYKEIAKR